MLGYIYIIKNDKNNKVYIGKTTKTIEQRFKEHLKDYKKRKEEQRPLYNAMKYYGVEHFWIEELEKTNIENLEDREIYWINYYNSYKSGYNATIGGDGKILYDYNEIIELYKYGFLQKEIAEKIGCSIDTVKKVLSSNDIKGQKNYHKKMMHPISAEKEGKSWEFNSQMEAANWLIENKITTSKDPDNVCGSIGRALRGKRGPYLGFTWKYL